MKSNEAMLHACSNSGCGWKCCGFGSDGHIVILPNELEQAVGSIEHLKIIDDNDLGGKKVKCIAENKATCDGGYKPIQCGLYPFWINSNNVMRSMKCPLESIDIAEHLVKAKEIISDYKKKNQDVNINDFLDNVYVDRYEIFK